VQRLHKHVATCGISALESVPVALFAFVIASDPKCSNELNYKLNSLDAFTEFKPIERVIFYAISFGGETHKIASMAGALAGAFFSRKELPNFMIKMCESHRELELYARKLFDISMSPNDLDYFLNNQDNQKQEDCMDISHNNNNNNNLKDSQTSSNCTNSLGNESILTHNHLNNMKASSSSTCSD
jgi:hypothetical protein